MDLPDCIKSRIPRIQELKNTLLERRYPVCLIKNGIERPKPIDIYGLRKTRIPHDMIKNFALLINVQSNEHGSIRHPSKNTSHYERLTSDKEKHGIHIVKSKRQPQPLERLLTSAKLPTKNTTPRVKKCNHPNCVTRIYSRRT